MKKKRRVLFATLALALCLCLTVAALAEGKLLTLYSAATRLLFDTDNATLNIHAVFSYNGRQFKTLDGSYIQDGSGSLMDIKLKTPQKDGSVLDSGYTVAAENGLAYSIEPVNNPNVYSVSNHSSDASILSSTLLRRTILRLGSAVAGAAEGALGDKIDVASQADGGSSYHIRLREGDTPELVNAAGTLLAQTAAKRFFYMDYDAISPASGRDEYLTIEYEDYDATLAHLYEQEYGEAMPEDFYVSMWSEDGSMNEQAYARYQRITDRFYSELVMPMEQSGRQGLGVILADGTVKYYDTLEEYMLAANYQRVEYEDGDAAFREFYRQQTGQELTREMLHAIYMSDNEELWDAFVALSAQMGEASKALLAQYPTAVVLYMYEDGSLRPFESYTAYEKMIALSSRTVTEQVLCSMSALEMGDADVTVTLDSQGRFAGAKGTACLLVEDEFGYKNKLEVTFEASAGQYGQSRVAPFDPAAYGVVSWDEYDGGGAFSSVGPARDGEEEIVLPETIMFNGVEYVVMTGEGSDNG